MSSEIEKLDEINISPLHGEDKPPNLPVMNGKDLISRDIEEIPMLLEPIFPKKGTIAIVGSSDIGKSTLLRQFAYSVAMNDKRFLDWNINAEHNRVLIVSTEDFDDSLTISLKRFNKSRRKLEDDFKNIHFITDIENLIEKIENFVREKPIDVLILDAYLDIYSGTNSKNDGGQIRQFLTKYDQLGNKYGYLTVWNHHCKKGTSNLTPGKDNVLGSQSFEAKSRLTIEIRPDLVDDNRRHLCFVKANYLSPSEFKNESFVIEHDENLFFTNTGEREPFENLRIEIKQKADLKQLVIKRYEDDDTIREIEVELRSQGYKISKSTIGRYIKEHKKDNEK